jgi:aspartyl-tRNA(Asn)/glutamyl-tRNA(Gln) amidotransferase subunit A
VLDDIDPAVMTAFEAALTALRKAGALIDELPFKELLELPRINRKGGLAAAESYAWHRRYLDSRGAEYDPRVRVRIVKGKEQDAADYIDLLAARADLIERIGRLTAPYDAVVMPTVAILAPTVAELTDDAAFTRANMLALRNTAVANFLDGCAISLPRLSVSC